MIFILKTNFFRKMNVHTMFRVSSYIIYVLADFRDTVPLRIRSVKAIFKFKPRLVIDFRFVPLNQDTIPLVMNL